MSILDYFTAHISVFSFCLIGPVGLPSICNSFQYTTVQPIRRITQHCFSEDNPGFSIIKESSDVSESEVILISAWPPEYSHKRLYKCPKTSLFTKNNRNLRTTFLNLWYCAVCKHEWTAFQGCKFCCLPISPLPLPSACHMLRCSNNLLHLLIPSCVLSML